MSTQLEKEAQALADRHAPQHPETGCWQALAAELAKIEALLSAVADAQALLAPVLTTAEAMRYTRHKSQSAFTRWAAAWRVSHSQKGRWPRQRLDKGLFDEACMGGKRRPRKGRAEEREAA